MQGSRVDSKHIGIVACSAEGAALCYRTICIEAATRLGAHKHPEISMHSPPLVDYVRCLRDNDLEGVASLMLGSAAKLACSGADFLICPDNTIHQALPLVLPRSPLPWLNIAEVVAAEASERRCRRVGVLGTHWLLASRVYPDALSAVGIECILPNRQASLELGRIIMDELVSGQFIEASILWLQSLIEKMETDGCDAVVLGCTELPLVLGDHNCRLPTLDSTRLLSRYSLIEATAQ